MRPMPIASINELPHIKLSIQSVDQASPIGLTMLYDTGAALNTGYLPYHRQIMKEHPSSVACYKEFNGSNPFDPIKLCGAITDPSAFKESLHGILSAVIEYHTPYYLSNGDAFKLSFALGESMSVNSILGLPTIVAGAIKPRWSDKYLSLTCLGPDSQSSFSKRNEHDCLWLVLLVLINLILPVHAVIQQCCPPLHPSLMLLCLKSVIAVLAPLSIRNDNYSCQSFHVAMLRFSTPTYVC